MISDVVVASNSLVLLLLALLILVEGVVIVGAIDFSGRCCYCWRY